MNNENQSGFHFYSLGIVAENKERNSDLVKVVPIEELPLASGQNESMVVKNNGNNRSNVQYSSQRKPVPMGKQTMTYEVGLPDHKSVNRSEKLTGDLTIVAKWTAIGQSNRVTSPDVIKGETIIIYRVNDTDTFFWSTVMIEPSVRRQETVCYMYGNIPTGLIPFDKDTSYWVEVSTHDKYVHIHTSNNDGEAAVWDIKLDTNQGIFSVTDNAGNDLEINSPAGTIVGNAVTKMTWRAPDIELDGQVKTTKDVDTTGSSKVGGSSEVGGSSSIGGGMSIGGGAGGGDIELKGNIILDGSISGTGNLSMAGTVSGSNI